MAETNHNNKKNVSLGKPKKTGCLYYAPAGTALPTNWSLIICLIPTSPY